MTSVRTMTAAEFVEQVAARLAAEPYRPGHNDFDAASRPVPPAAYALIVGAGFSHGVVPMVRQLMHETVGDFYFPDQDQSSMKRAPAVLQRHSADFWSEFNRAAGANDLPLIEVDGDGLPADPGTTYQALFTYEGVNALFAMKEPEKQGYLANLQRKRDTIAGAGRRQRPPSRDGEVFAREFLQRIIDAGAEHGYGSTGRGDLNEATIYLAALLEAQQSGHGWHTRAFCRTILTTNFDTSLQNCLQLVNLLYLITDRPERGLDQSDFPGNETAVHLVYTHGSILRRNPASSVLELGELATRNADVLQRFLQTRDVITIGYSGWDDGLMAALRRCDGSRQHLYWCGVGAAPPPHIADFLSQRAGHADYVQLGKAGAGGLLRSLYRGLVPAEAQRDPWERYRKWAALKPVEGACG
jgi:SIR2-like domain